MTKADKNASWMLLLPRLAPEYRNSELTMIRSKLESTGTVEIYLWIQSANLNKIDKWLGESVVCQSNYIWAK